MAQYHEMHINGNILCAREWIMFIFLMKAKALPHPLIKNKVPRLIS
jgi:hypothetical protein